MSDDTRLLLFDVDGTLIEGGTPAHRRAVELAVHDVYGIDTDYSSFEVPGQTDRYIIAEMLRRNGVDMARIEAGLPDAFAAVERYVEAHPEGLHATVLPGIAELFELLRGRHHLGLITGNLPGVARAKLRAVGLLGAVQVAGELVGGFGDISEDRADIVRAAIASACRVYGRDFAATNTVVIGDTPNDIRAGRAAGTICVGVATGPHSVERLGDADMVVDSFIDAAACAEQLLAARVA